MLSQKKIFASLILITFTSALRAQENIDYNYKDLSDVIVKYNQLKKHHREELVQIDGDEKFFLESIAALEKFSILIPPLILLWFSQLKHAALGGDILTGNALVEGKTDKQFVMLKLNDELLKTEHISLAEMYEILTHLQDDIDDHNKYLKDHPYKELILKTLRQRQDRLLNKFTQITHRIFHFREHPSLEEHQQTALLILMTVIPLFAAIASIASYDLQHRQWQTPSQEMLKQNIQLMLNVLHGKLKS